MAARAVVFRTYRPFPVVRNYLEVLWNDGRVAEAETLVAEDLIQHNPKLADGRRALVDYVEDARRHLPDMRFDLRRTVAEGDLVVAHSLLTAAGGAVAMAVIDIYRIAGGRIVEHWDATEDVPEKTASGHPIV